MLNIKLITFDLDNTLWPVQDVIMRAEKACQDYLAEQHPEAAAHLQLPQLMVLRKQTLAQNPELIHNLTELRKQVLAQGFQNANYSEKDARQFGEAAFAVFQDERNNVNLFPGVKELLTDLSGRFTIGALSNGNANLAATDFGHLFDFQHNSESVGKRKPAPDMFHAALKSASVNPEQALHIGDHPEEDIHAAREQGFHTIWVNFFNESWPEALAQPQYHSPDIDTLIEQINAITR